MTDFKSELREILDDAFQRGFHFCDDERTGECWQNDEAYKSLDDIIALFISKLPKEVDYKDVYEYKKKYGIKVSEAIQEADIYNSCLADIKGEIE